MMWSVDVLAVGMCNEHRRQFVHGILAKVQQVRER
jgi:hypothetical protein